MDAVKVARLLATSLLAILGIIYLALSTLNLGVEIPAAVLVLVGLIYIAVGIGLFMNKRIFIYLGVLAPLVWASLGAYSYIAVKPQPIYLPFIATEIVIILCCCYLIFRRTPKPEKISEPSP